MTYSAAYGPDIHDYRGPVLQERIAANTAAVRDRKGRALREIESVGFERAAGPVDETATDTAHCELARRRAELMLDRVAALCEPVTREWLNGQVEAMEARPLPDFDPAGAPVADQLAGMVRRVCCALWWRRQVRRAAVRKREAKAQRAGLVSVRMSQPYVTNETVRRREQRLVQNRAMLEATEIESADGEVIALWQAVEASTANLAIRRGELMTRIRGAEEWATAGGMVGLFTTNTVPSRFHAQHFKGGANRNYDGSTPREAQGWLCKTWARARAKIKREGIKVFGFRVAEPHHDGCPHWHMLLWAPAADMLALQAIMRAHWLADAGDEPGAALHRVKFEAIDPAKGGAVAYVAKYIAKNIDDAGAVGAEGHRDHRDGEQLEIVEGGNKARRVMAWASAWGIRQFQAIGQPPVIVWRELRRVSAQAAEGASVDLQDAHRAVNREGGRRACWRAYMDAQGGAMTGRGYRVGMLTEPEQREGRYGVAEVERVLGVIDLSRPDDWILSGRKQWRPRGTWAAGQRETARAGDWGAVRDWLFARPQAAPAWTRVNNCTRAGGPEFLLEVARRGRAQSFEVPGGNLDLEPWIKPPPTPPATPPRASRIAPTSPAHSLPQLRPPEVRLSSLRAFVTGLH